MNDIRGMEQMLMAMKNIPCSLSLNTNMNCSGWFMYKGDQTIFTVHEQE
jgi:hypothetical protein